LKKLEIWTTVKEKDIGRVAKGQNARFTVDAFPKKTFSGRVTAIRLNATVRQDVVS
jgi:HlyD family secretion protein